MQKKNLTWLIFISAISIIVAWFITSTLIEIYHFSQLNQSVDPSEMAWSYHEISKDTYQIHVTYQYEVNEHLYSNDHLFKKPVLFNPLAAKQVAEEFSHKEWKAWYNKTNPQYTSLEKIFPTKSLISSIILLLLLFYFIGLGIYAQRKSV